MVGVFLGKLRRELQGRPRALHGERIGALVSRAGSTRGRELRLPSAEGTAKSSATTGTPPARPGALGAGLRRSQWGSSRSHGCTPPSSSPWYMEVAPPINSAPVRAIKIVGAGPRPRIGAFPRDLSSPRRSCSSPSADTISAARDFPGLHDLRLDGLLVGHRTPRGD